MIFLKKHKITIICIISILLVLLLISFFFQPTMSKQEIMRLINSSNKYTNYTLDYTVTSTEGTQEFQVKVRDTIHTLKTPETFAWQSKEANQLIFIDYIAHTYMVAPIDLQLQSEIGRLGNKYFPYLDNDEYEFSYIGKKSYQNKKCIIVEFKNLPSNIWFSIWIEEETGIVLKEEFYTITQTGKKEQTSSIIEYHIKFDNVSAQDVEKPNVDSFEAIQ